MAFKNLEMGVLEAFAETSHYNGDRQQGQRERRELDLGLHSRKPIKTAHDLFPWLAVVQCRLCATEHPSEESLRGHFRKAHPKQHAATALINKELQLSHARALKPDHRRSIERRIELLTAQLDRARAELARLPR